MMALANRVRVVPLNRLVSESKIFHFELQHTDVGWGCQNGRLQKSEDNVSSPCDRLVLQTDL